MAFRLDRAIRALEGQGLTPVTILLSEPDYRALANLGQWPVTRSSRGDIRYHCISVFQAREGEGVAFVGRGASGVTRRVVFEAAGAPVLAGPQPK